MVLPEYLRARTLLPTRILLVAFFYAATGWLGLRMPYIGEHITLIWLPTGIAVAALHNWGWRVWPGIFLGALVVNLSIGSSPALAALIALGNTAGPAAAEWLLRRSGFRRTFERQIDVVLLVLAAGLGMAISSANGVANLYLAGLLPSGAVADAWSKWWMGDTVGVLLATPLLLGFSRDNVRQLLSAPREWLAWLVVAIFVGWLSFVYHDGQAGRTLPLAFLTLPLITWASLRFGMSGAAFSALLFSCFAAIATAQGRGTFYLLDAQVSLFLLWAYMTATVLTGLMVTALQAERHRIEMTLRASEEKLRGLFDLSPVGIALTDMQGRYVEFNAAFARICGYSAEELRSIDYWTLTPERYRDDEARQLQLLEDTGRYGPYEKEYVRKDGSHVPLRLNGMLVTGGDGKTYIWSLVEDISDRRRAESELINARDSAEAASLALKESEASFRLMFDDAPDAYLIMGLREGRIFACNHAAERMLRGSREQIVGSDPTSLSPPLQPGGRPTHEFVAENIATVLRQGRHRFEHMHRRLDGEDFWAEVSIALGSYHGQQVLFVAWREISEIIAAKQAAEAANIAKSRFLATMSHEIRTPMNGILGMAQMLLMEKVEEEERRDYARTILNSGQTLLTLLNDILDFSKIEAGKLELDLSTVDPAQILHETANLFHENAADKGLELDVHWAGAPRRYLADPHRLRQMLSNLTNNAIKFTQQGRVSLQAKEVERSEGKALIEFSVSDTGIGIEADKQELLFKPFTQADSSITRQFGGTGLGLSIVRSLALKMGGDVGVDSTPGQGTRFWFRIRADSVQEGVDGRSPARAHEETALASRRLKGNILIVEDNPTNQIVIQAVLNRLGPTCQIASDGQAGVFAVEQDPSIDLILMDIQMPVMDGYEATRRIRAWEAGTQQRHRSIIALTADAFDEDRRRCLDAGMDDFLAKPINVDKLTLALQRWLPAT